MQIGIYKPFKKIYFHDDRLDTANWSSEITKTAKIFADNDNEVFILSDTDYDGSIDGIHRGKLNCKYDRILFFNGLIERDKHGSRILEMLNNISPRVDFMISDMGLINHSIANFNKIYTQSPIIAYNGLPELQLYGHNFQKLTTDTILNKTIPYSFGGTERNRTKDFIEYVWRHNCCVNGKSDFLRFRDKITRDEFLITQDLTRYSICISDVNYNKIGFITARYYENIMHDIVNFVDYKYDKYEHCLAHDDWRRVHNFIELQNKMNFLEAHPDEHLKILQMQRKEIKPTMLTGKYTYDLLRE